MNQNARRLFALSIVLAAGSIASAQPSLLRELVLSTADNPNVDGAGYVPASGSLNGTQTWLKRYNSAFQSTAATIDGNGNVAFTAVLTAGADSNGFDAGVVGGPFSSGVGFNQFTFWYGGPGSLSLQARYGDATLDNANCGGPGATFINRASSSIPISPNGYMWFGGYQITGGTTTTLDRNVVWAGQAGAFHNLARGNDLLPNVGNSQLSANTTSANSQMAAMNNFGQCPMYLQTRLGIGDTTATFNDNNYFLGVATAGSPASIRKILRRGDDLLGGGSRALTGFYDPAINHAGTVFDVYGMETGAGGVAGPGGVSGNDDYLLVMSTTSGGAYTNTIFGREGGPTGAGALEYAVAPTSSDPFFGGPASPFMPTGGQFLNNGGRVIFVANLKQGVAGVTAEDDAALMTYKNGVTSVVFREGDVLFGIAPIAFGVQSGNPPYNIHLNNSDQVSWIGHFAITPGGAGPITASNDEFLAISTIDASGSVTHKLIAREGDQIPGMAAGVHWSQPLPIRGDSTFGNTAFNGSGLLRFFARIDGPGVTRDDAATLGDDYTYWLYSPASGGKFRKIARRGDSVGGMVVSSVYTNTGRNGEGCSNGINDENWLTWTIDDGVNYGAIYRSRVCLADLDDGTSSGNADGGVDINDLLYFLNAFETGSITADLDNDGDPTFSVPDSGVDINDLLFFLSHFESGC